MWYPNIAQQLDQLGPQGLEIFLRQMMDTLAQITNHEVAFVEVLHEERVLTDVEMKSVLARGTKYERNVAAYNKVIANGVGRVLVWALYVSENHHVISEIQTQLLTKSPIAKDSITTEPPLLSSYFGSMSSTPTVPSQNFGSNNSLLSAISAAAAAAAAATSSQSAMRTQQQVGVDWSQNNFNNIVSSSSSSSPQYSQNNYSTPIPSMDYDQSSAFSTTTTIPAPPPAASVPQTTPMTSPPSSHQQENKDGTLSWFDSVVDVLMQYQDANFGFEEEESNNQSQTMAYDDISEDGGGFSYSNFLANSTNNSQHFGGQ